MSTYLSNAKQLQNIRLLRAMAAASMVPSLLLIGLLKVSSLFNPSSWHILSKYNIVLSNWLFSPHSIIDNVLPDCNTTIHPSSISLWLLSFNWCNLKDNGLVIPCTRCTAIFQTRHDTPELQIWYSWFKHSDINQ